MRLTTWTLAYIVSGAGAFLLGQGMSGAANLSGFAPFAVISVVLAVIKLAGDAVDHVDSPGGVAVQSPAAHGRLVLDRGVLTGGYIVVMVGSLIAGLVTG